MQTLAGSVSAFFALEGFDRRRGVATYALRIVNRTASALICRTWVVLQNGDSVLAYPAILEIEPFSTSAMQVPVWPADFSSFERAVAEIAGEGVQCIVEAPAPAVVRPEQTLVRFALAAAAAGLIALAGAAGFRAAAPRISAFAVPPEALAGTTIRAEYDAGGAGKLGYSVLAPDGRQIAGGILTGRSGSIPIALPASNQPGAYTLQMTMAGVLGTAEETRVLNTLPGKGEVASISAISVLPVVARAGQSVKVAYGAGGDGGFVRLVGADGTIWAQQPFSSSGETQLAVPPVTSSQEMRVLLRVTKGRSAAETVAGLVVLPASARASAAVFAPASQIAGDDDPTSGAAASSDANGTFELGAATVKSGETIRVRILSPRNGMRVSLTDGQSHEVTGVSVGADADLITLKAPAVTVPTRYTVVASFTDGFGQESVVAPVTVVP